MVLLAVVIHCCVKTAALDWCSWQLARGAAVLARAWGCHLAGPDATCLLRTWQHTPGQLRPVAQPVQLASAPSGADYHSPGRCSVLVSQEVHALQRCSVASPALSPQQVALQTLHHAAQQLVSILLPAGLEAAAEEVQVAVDAVRRVRSPRGGEAADDLGLEHACCAAACLQAATTRVASLQANVGQRRKVGQALQHAVHVAAVAQVVEAHADAQAALPVCLQLVVALGLRGQEQCGRDDVRRC
jgi:hypothetical protein